VVRAGTQAAMPLPPTPAPPVVRAGTAAAMPIPDPRAPAPPAAAPPPPAPGAPPAAPPAAPPGQQFRNPTSAKGTLLGTMPVLDEEVIRRAQEQLRGGTQVTGKGGAAPLPPDDKDKK
jgi:hypothetical protein